MVQMVFPRGDDVQILEIVQVTGWFNCIIRIADALGIKVEEWRADRQKGIFGAQPTQSGSA